MKRPSEQLLEATKKSKGYDPEWLRHELMDNCRDGDVQRSFGEFECSGSLEDRMNEIAFNLGYEYGYGVVHNMPRKTLDKTKGVFESMIPLARKEKFTARFNKSWKEGVKSGSGGD